MRRIFRAGLPGGRLESENFVLIEDLRVNLMRIGLEHSDSNWFYQSLQADNCRQYTMYLHSLKYRTKCNFSACILRHLKLAPLLPCCS